VEPDLAGDEIHQLIVFKFQIDDPALPKVGTGRPVAALSAIIWYPGVRNDAFVFPPGRRSSNERPRPESRRGAASPRFPSSRLNTHFISRFGVQRDHGALLPAVVYTRTLATSGVDSRLNSAGPEVVVLNRHATSTFLEVAGVDLVERRVPRAGEVRAVLATRRSVMPVIPVMNALRTAPSPASTLSTGPETQTDEGAKGREPRDRGFVS